VQYAILIFLVVAASTPAQAAAPFRDCPDCPAMVTVPAGSFQMGASEKEVRTAVGVGVARDDLKMEQPQHQVSVASFAMATTEVTREQFDTFVRDSGYQAGAPCWSMSGAKPVKSATNDWRNPGFAQSSKHPVACVTWEDARAYARWLGQKTGKSYRLPTEAEWEYAARAGSTVGTSWGKASADACQYANVANSSAVPPSQLVKAFPCADGFANTAPVAQFRANAFGLYDMLGNLWEWTEDCYNASYVGAPANSSAWLAGDCSQHMFRGGSWHANPRFVRSTIRDWDFTTFRSNILGFRVARTN